MELCGSKDLGAIAGGQYLDSGATAVATGDFFAITALAAASVTLVNKKAAAGAILGNALTAVPIPAGTTIYGRFESVTFVSGKGIAYNNK